MNACAVTAHDIRTLRRRGAGIGAVAAADQLDLEADGGRIAIEIVVTLRELGRLNEAYGVVRRLGWRKLDKSCAERLILEATYLRLLMHFDVEAALRRSRLRSAPKAGADETDWAEAERLRCAMLLTCSSIGELADDERDATYARLAVAADVLARGGHVVEALYARKVCANRHVSDLPTRRSGLVAVADEASRIGAFAVAGDIYADLAEILLTADVKADEVRACLAQAKAAFRLAGHSLGTVTVAYVGALAEYRLGDPEAPGFDKYLHDFEALGCAAGQARVLLAMATRALDANLPEAASRAIEQVDRVAQEHGNRLVLSSSLAAQAHWLFAAGFHSRSKAVCEAELQNRLPARLRACFLSLLSGAASQGGDHPTALETARESHKIFLEKNDGEGASSAVSRIVVELGVLRPDGWLNEACDALLRTADADIRLGAPDRAAARLDQIASTLLAEAQRDPGNAAAFIDQAMGYLDRATGFAGLLEPRMRDARLAQIIRNRSLVAGLQGDFAEQAAGVAESARLFEAAGRQLDAADARYILGCIYYNRTHEDLLAHFGEAETQLVAAIRYYDQAGMRDRAARARQILARLFVRAADATRGDLQKRMRAAGLEQLANAESDLDLLRRDFLGRSTAETRLGKQAFTRDAQQVRDTALRVIIGRLEDWSLAWEWVQRGKSRQLSDMLGAGTKVPAHVARRISEQPVLLNLIAEEQRIARTMAGARPIDRPSLRNAHDAVLGKLANEPDVAEYLALRTGGIQTAAALQALDEAAGEAGAVLVDWSSVADRLFIIARRTGHNPDVRWIDTSTDRVRHLISMYLAPDSIRSTLLGMPMLLRDFDPLVSALGELTVPGEHLVLSPTAPLHGIPLHALHVGGKVLLERNPVSYTPALAVLHHCLARQGASRASPKVAIFGNPGGDRDGSEGLLTDLGKRFGSQPMLRQSVTRAALEAAMEQADIVHFHGHAIYDLAKPMESGLMLADGTITAGQLFDQVGIEAGLIVLCACETGTSLVNAGDDPLGLVPALLVGGASRVVASLWRVYDQSATALMRRFYDGLSRQGSLNLAGVLQQAALAVRDSGFAEPFHWAPFILQGDWRWGDRT